MKRGSCRSEGDVGERRGAPRAACAALALLAALLGCGVGKASGGSADRDAVAEPPTATVEAPAPSDTGRDYDIPHLPAEKLRLTGAATGLDDPLRTIETSLAQRDSARLQELMVTPREYEEILFPSFPAAHPPIDASFETIWVLHVTDAQRGLRRVLRDHGGKDVRILDVRFERPDQDFVNFVLDETSRVDLEVNGARVKNVQLFGSVLHIGDQYKVLSYPD